MSSVVQAEFSLLSFMPYPLSLTSHASHHALYSSLWTCRKWIHFRSSSSFPLLYCQRLLCSFAQQLNQHKMKINQLMKNHKNNGEGERTRPKRGERGRRDEQWNDENFAGDRERDKGGKFKYRMKERKNIQKTQKYTHSVTFVFLENIIFVVYEEVGGRSTFKHIHFYSV